VLVSEVMLQQTQAARVAPAFERFVAAFPTVGSLASGSPAEVLRAWGGLGYNRRALNLHRAARMIVRDRDGHVPSDPAVLVTLPGVGPYTAAAVGSFAFGAQVAAVDTNARRVAERLGHGPPGALLPPGRAADWNQAAMELGATVCTARTPRCDACPVARWCMSAGRASVAPRAAPGRGGSERFEDTNRWVRGRVVAALAAGDGLPGDIAPERLERAVAGLVRDGLVRPVQGGFSLG
jgi:A/G-specific adenine glycosylase